MNDTFWKLRHKPTGLFYKPSSQGSKSQLSPTGKTYSARKPKLKNLGSFIYVSFKQMEGTSCAYKEIGRWHDARLEVVPNEWEIVNYRVIEDGVEDVG